MEYYTWHELSTLENVTKEEDDIIREFLKDKFYSEFGYCELLSVPAKSYYHEKFMLELSKKLPRITFLLEGAGEENGDNWREYYKNEKFKRMKAKLNKKELIWKNFDETMLV